MTPTATLYTLDDALRIEAAQNVEFHLRHLNHRYVRLARFLEMERPIGHASGSVFWDDAGTEYVDFLAGFGALNLGHNHPRVREALERVETLPNLVEGLSPLEGALAHNLASLAPGALERVHFANSGAEVVDAAIKLARAATKRTKLVACRSSFHGRTIGALSVMDGVAQRAPFEPLLPGVTFVPFGDSSALEAALRGRNVAGFIVEPIQGEAGMVVPAAGYLRTARDLCARYGTVFIADEIQTGCGRTGAMFALDHEAIAPDVLLLGKALGGGVMAVSALLTTDALYHAARGGTERTPLHLATYGGNTRACAAALATLEVLVAEKLPERAAASGTYLLDRLRALQSRQPLIADVRGQGLMIGVELSPATRGLATMATGGVVNHLSRKFFAGLIIKHLITRYRIVTAITLNNHNVIRLEPPLNVEQRHLDYAVESLAETLDAMASFARTARRSLPDLVRAVRI